MSNDGPYWQCSGCGRKSWAAREVGRVCAMPQPSGQTCTGRFSAPQPAPMRLSTPVPLPWDMPTLSREDARIAREQINPAPRWPSQPEPDKVIASCEAGIDECSFECQQYGQRHTPENAGTACPTGQTVDVPQPATSGDEAKVREIVHRAVNRINALNAPLSAAVQCAITGAVREAIIAGKADGARAEREACEKLATDQAEKQEIKAGYYSAAAGACDQIADEISRRSIIARRGSEGK